MRAQIDVFCSALLAVLFSYYSTKNKSSFVNVFRRLLFTTIQLLCSTVQSVGGGSRTVVKADKIVVTRSEMPR